MIPQIEIYSLEESGIFSKNAINKKVHTAAGEKILHYEKFLPEKKDALLEEIDDFINSIEKRISPNVSGEDGKRALEIALEVENKIFLNE